MLIRVDLAEEVVHDMTVDQRAAGQIVAGLLCQLRATGLVARDSHLLPIALDVEDGLYQLGIVDVEGVWSDAHNRSVFLVQGCEIQMKVSARYAVEAPEVGEFYSC